MQITADESKSIPPSLPLPHKQAKPTLCGSLLNIPQNVIWPRLPTISKIPVPLWHGPFNWRAPTSLGLFSPDKNERVPAAGKTGLSPTSSAGPTFRHWSKSEKPPITRSKVLPPLGVKFLPLLMWQVKYLPPLGVKFLPLLMWQVKYLPPLGWKLKDLPALGWKVSHNKGVRPPTLGVKGERSLTTGTTAFP